MKKIAIDYEIMFTGRGMAELVATELDERPPEPDEVVGYTIRSLISPGTELASYLGTNFPVTVGYAAVFTVEAVGGDVHDIKAGDRVFCMGSHRWYQRFPRSQVIPLPEGLLPDEALFGRLMAVTMSTLTTTAARPPEMVIVTGLGIIGHLGARIFNLCGYEVIACDPSLARRNLALRAGLNQVSASVPLTDPEIAGHAALVLECSGHEQAAANGCKVVRPGGEVVLVGVPWGRKTELYAHDLLHDVFHRYVTLRSGWEWELPVRPENFRQGSIFGNIKAAMLWLADGRLDLDELYEMMPVNKPQEAYGKLAERPDVPLTMVFDWSQCLHP